jgi:hypothetical protein
MGETSQPVPFDLFPELMPVLSQTQPKTFSNCDRRLHLRVFRTRVLLHDSFPTVTPRPHSLNCERTLALCVVSLLLHPFSQVCTK